MSRLVQLRVLFENSRNRRTKGFGPEELLLACLADRLDRSIWRLRQQVEVRCCNGDDKLLDTLVQEADVLPAKGATVIAVPDNDRIRTRLRLANTAPPAEVEAAVRQRIGQPCMWLSVLPLCGEPATSVSGVPSGNMETLVHAAADVLGRPAGDPLRLRAVLKKEHEARDAILGDLANSSSEVRAKLTLASWAALLDCAVHALVARDVELE